MKASGQNGTGLHDPGTYVLILGISRKARVQIGKLGRFDLTPGYYGYVGSAFGPGGVGSRLVHHLRPVRRPHWHVDHLRKVAHVEETWYAVHDQRREHQWAAMLLGMPNASMAIPGFGSSDCRCPSHLLYFPARPAAGQFLRLLGARRGAIGELQASNCSCVGVVSL